MRTQILHAFVLLTAMTFTALAQSPTLVSDINPSMDENVQILTGSDDLNGVVYFSGNDGSGEKLWRTDGTAAGTYLVKDLLVQPKINSLNGSIYFAAYNSVGGLDLWVSDGTTSGTIQLTTYSLRKSQTAIYRDFIEMGSNVYFVYAIYDMRRSIFTDELWRSDGTASGTNEIYTLNWIEYMRDGGDKVYLFGADGYYTAGSGEEPWVSDGTTAGTNLILDICPINGTGSNHCDEYYVSTTGLNRNVLESKDYPTVANGIWYFSKSDGVYGMELWKSDGTATGTTRLTDINPGSASSCPYFMVEMNNTLYFTADDGTRGMELWKYPLPNGPAALVKDIADNSASSEPIWLTPVNGTLYFSAWTSDGGRELWKSDGTDAGTVQVTEIASGSLSSNPNYDKITEIVHSSQREDWRMFAVLGDKIYFAADDGAGYELWESDGTVSGTVKTADINPNINEGSSPRYLTAVGDRLLFIAYHPSYGNEWWVYNTGSNIPPTASANATPTSGTAPLLVSFDGSGSSDPDGTITGYVWDFGDGIGSSSQMSPSYTYTNPGTYTAQLTVTDDSYATAVDDVTITVTSSGAYVYVADQTVSRVVGGGNKIHAEDVVLIEDNVGQTVSGAIVSASYTGPTSGIVSGTTGINGTVTLESSWVRNPSGTWCFTVTNVQASGKTYNSSANVVTEQCEGTPKASALLPATCTLHPNTPNPFATSTTIRFSLPESETVTLRVYDMLGRSVATLAEGTYTRGTHELIFQRKALPAGTYILQLRAGATTVTRHMLCVR